MRGVLGKMLTTFTTLKVIPSTRAAMSASFTGSVLKNLMMALDFLHRAQAFDLDKWASFLQNSAL
jgi:hypothetical protein